MSDSSFYGGQPGFSFIIVKNYLSIVDMVNDFKQGPDFTAVHFDEHVLINTVNKNDPDNGKVYRRGYDYTNEMGGAVYIGTIVGPAGKAPMVEMTTVDYVKNMQETEGYTYRYSEGQYSPLINLIPGKTEDGKFNDAIQWACCSVRNPNNEDTTAYIGFIFPYPVLDFTSYSVSPYYNRDNDTDHFTNINIIDRIDDKQHPYYEKWNISVPKGIKGDTFKNFRVIPANNNIIDYDGKQDDINNGREVLVYDYYHYDKDGGGEPVTIYLGDYNMINSITIDDDGTFTIDYAHDDNLVYPHKFKWIKSVTLQSNGHFTIIYNYPNENNGTPTIYETDLQWVDDITMAHNGIVTLHYSIGTTKDLKEQLTWIDGIELHENGVITITYNNKVQDLQKILRWINDIRIDKDGTFTIEYNNKISTWENLLTWVEDITLTDDGTLSCVYNNGDKTFDKVFKWIDDVQLDETGTISVIYNNSDRKDLEQILRWVEDIIIDEDGTFTIQYNNMQKRWDGLIRWLTAAELSEDGSLTFVYNNGEEIYNRVIKWIDDIQLDQSGNVLISYNNDEQKILEHVLKWIEDIRLDEDGTFTVVCNNEIKRWGELFRWIKEFHMEKDGTLTVIYNNGSEVYDRAITWMEDFQIDEEGTIKVFLNNGDIITKENAIKWVNDITFSDDGTLNILYNYGNESLHENMIKWITKISLEQNGEFKIEFNNGDEPYLSKLTWVEDIIVDDDGTVSIIYNNGEPFTYNNLIKYVDDIYVNTGGNQKIHVKYNTGDEEDIGEPINYILETALTPDYHYIVRYSDPEKRNKIIQDKLNYTYLGLNDWHDLGSVKDDSGILIGLNIYSEELKANIKKSIEYLNNEFPNGLTGDLKGKVVTIGTNTESPKDFYAFDYSKENNEYKKWYYLGRIERINSIIASKTDEDVEAKKESLSIGGIWFILE